MLSLWPRCFLKKYNILHLFSPPSVFQALLVALLLSLFSTSSFALGTPITEFKKLLASDGMAQDRFGYQIAASGDTLVAGAWGVDDMGSDSGAIYLYERNLGGPNNWGEVKKITPFDGEAIDNFGWTVTLQGDTLIVGSQKDDDNFADSGSVYIYERNIGGPENWGLLKKIYASDGEAGDWYGATVTLVGDTLVVAALKDDDMGVDSGSIYIHERNQGGVNNWGQVTKIVASDGVTLDRFGKFISLESDTLVVGAPNRDGDAGGAYIFGRNQGGANNWGEIKILLPADVAPVDRFGGSVSVDGDFVVVSSWADDDFGDQSGSVFLYGRNQGGVDNWGLIKKINSSEASAYDQFGFRTAIKGDLLLISSLNEDNGLNFATDGDSGAVYLFARHRGGTDQWGEAAKYIASDGTKDSKLGFWTAFNGNDIWVGAAFENETATRAGAVYLFDMPPENELTLPEKKIYLPTDWWPTMWSLDVNGDRIAVGAPWDDENENALGDDAGAVHIFERDQGGLDNWGHVKKVLSTNIVHSPVYDLLGWDVALQGEDLVAGAIQDDLMNWGKAYIYEQNSGGPDNWGQTEIIEQGTLMPIETQMRYGWSIGLTDEWLVVGTERCQKNPPMNGGCAFVHKHNADGSWSYIKRLVSSDRLREDYFGRAVAIDAETMVIGAPGRDNLTEYGYGAAYIFGRDQGGSENWGEVAKLSPPGLVDFDSFGFAVAIEGDVAVVGSHGKDSTGGDPNSGFGAAYVFERNEGGVDNWGLVKTLLASDRQPWDTFGYSVAIEGDNILIGAPAHNPVPGFSNEPGGVYLFNRNEGGANNWGEARKITASDSAPDDQFGLPVKIENDTIFIMARRDDDQGQDTGSLYIYNLNELVEQPQEYILPDNQWRQISMPCDAEALNSVNDIFVDDMPNLASGYGTDWALWFYDTDSSSYVAPNLADPVLLGRGYWVIQISGAPITIDMPLPCTAVSVVASSQCSGVDGCFSISPATIAGGVQWNMPGFPFSSGSVTIDQLRVSADSGDCSDADGCTQDQAETAGVLHNVMWRYNGSAYDELSGAALLNPWDGFWTPTLDGANGLNPKLLIPQP